MSEQLPSKQRALSLLVKSGCSVEVIKHSKAVATIAKRIAEACKKNEIKVNVKLVEVSAILHDIGRSRTHLVGHAIVGSKIAESLGLPKPVITIIERHVGGGITVDEAERLGWPVKSYLPQTIEEKIVTYADKLIEDSKRVPIKITIKKLSKELGNTHPSIERIRKLHEEIFSLIGDFNGKSHIN